MLRGQHYTAYNLQPSVPHQPVPISALSHNPPVPSFALQLQRHPAWQQKIYAFGVSFLLQCNHFYMQDTCFNSSYCHDTLKIPFFVINLDNHVRHDSLPGSLCVAPAQMGANCSNSATSAVTKICLLATL